MASTWKCRACQVELAGSSHLMLARGLQGHRGLCLTCADRLMDKYHTRTLHELVPRYIKDQREDTPLRALQERVRQLEALLEEVTKPNP